MLLVAYSPTVTHLLLYRPPVLCVCLPVPHNDLEKPLIV